MPRFYGIEPGKTVTGEGIRIEVAADGESVWMHGKWLELAAHHAVVVFSGRARFVTGSGRSLSLGDFPAWVVRGKGKSPVIAAMFDVSQFIGGQIELETGHIAVV